jgi:hypothetical protein
MIVKIIIGLIALAVCITLCFIFIFVLSEGLDKLSCNLSRFKIHKVFKVIWKIIVVVWYSLWIGMAAVALLGLSYDFGNTIVNWFK